MKFLTRFLFCIGLLLFPAVQETYANNTGKEIPVNVSVSPQQLDQAIEEQMRRREYRWRIPADQVPDQPKGLFVEFWESALRVTKRWLQPFANLWRKIRNWIRDHFPSFEPPSADSDSQKFGGQLPLLVLLTAVVLAVLLLLFFKWRKRKSSEPVVVAQPVAALPDLQQEDVVADQLPEEGWQKMAWDLASQGDYRLALRAFFMATLAHLGHSGVIRIARFKSNRDYQKELSRKALDRSELLSVFDENVSVLERVWYGNHPASEEMLTHFAQNHQRMIESAA